MTTLCHDRPLGDLVQVTGERYGDIDVVVPAIRVGQPHTEEGGSESGVCHDFGNFKDLFLLNSGDFIGKIITVTIHDHPECIEEFVIMALLYLQVVIGYICGVGVPGVNDNDGTLFLSLSGEETPGEDRIA